MKNLFITILLLSALTVSAKPYNIKGSKSGGKIVNVGLESYIGYNKVEYSSGDGTVTFKCEGKGNTACRGNVDGTMMDFVTSNGNTFYYDDYMKTINSLMDEMDEMFLKEETLSGKYTKQVSAVSNEGVRCTLVFGIIWDLDKSGDGNFSIMIDELDYFSF